MPVVLRPGAQVSHPKGHLLLLSSVSDFYVWVPLLFIPSATQVLSHMICVGPATPTHPCSGAYEDTLSSSSFA